MVMTGDRMTTGRYCVISWIILCAMFTGCLSLSVKQRDRKTLEAEAVAALFKDIYQNGAPGILTSKTNGIRVEVMFIAYGAPGWDGNLSPRLEFFAPAPAEWLDKIRYVTNISIKSLDNAIYNQDENRIRDKKTRALGAIFEVELLEWIGSDEIRIKYMNYMGVMLSSGGCYILKREQNHWKIVRMEDLWI